MKETSIVTLAFVFIFFSAEASNHHHVHHHDQLAGQFYDENKQHQKHAAEAHHHFHHLDPRGGHIYDENEQHRKHSAVASITNPILQEQADRTASSANMINNMCPGRNICTNCVYDASGNPIASNYCNDYPCPATVCCAAEEETCYNENSSAVSCARLGSVGCPCPEHEMRCGNSTNSFGWCDVICCDPATEKVCKDEEGEPFCANTCAQTRHANLRAKT